MGRGSKVYRLAQIIRGRVIALSIPGSKRLLFRRAAHPTELESKCRHTLFDKAVLVAADKPIVLWFLIRLYLHTRFTRNYANVVAQGRLIQALDFKIF